MPKRSFDEKMEYYLRKMEKLKDKHRRKRRRHSVPSSDEENNKYVQEGEPYYEETTPLPNADETVITTEPAVVDQTQIEVPAVPASTAQPDPPPPPAQPDPPPPPAQPDPPPPPAPPVETEACPPLDPEILQALGEATDSGPLWGQEIHSNLAQLWLPLLKSGMNKEAKEQVLKQYLIPSNCTLLQAPKLNIEISAAVIEMTRSRDKKVEGNQQQLGTGITAISRAMTSLLTSDNKVDAIKMLSDGCRILCDLHYTETQARIKMITPGLAKPFLSVIQESERDETLFGVGLPEKIKASKTIEKQGLQIKKSVPTSRPAYTPAVASTSGTRQQFQGNWNGSPRYPTNRGGRGGQRRIPPSTRRPAPTTSTHHKTNPSRTRAHPRP